MNKKDGYKNLTSPKKAVKKYLELIKPLEITRKIKLEQAVGRVIAKDIKSPVNVPHYNRSAMDGYAVKARDTYGSTETSPNHLDIVKDEPGEGECKHVHTGSETPSTTNAVIKKEDTEKIDNELKIFKPVSPGENISPVGEDVEKGSQILDKGHRLRPIDLGLLRTIKKEEITVKKKPTISILPTGDEVISPGEEPEPGQVIESNSITIAQKTKKWGANPKKHSITPDNPEKIVEAIKENLDKDIITIIGGSSVGERDHTTQIINEEGRIYFDGIAMKPGKPTILGEIQDTPIIGLPGYPVATAISAKTFLKPVIQKKGGVKQQPRWIKRAELTRKIHSEPGYQTHTRVKLEKNKATPLRTSGAGIITSITEADGIVTIEMDSEGKEKGETIEVEPLD